MALTDWHMKFFYTWVGSLLLSIFSCSTAIAQDSSLALSRFEEFSTSRGRLLKMESVSTGNFGNLYSEFVSVTDLNSKEMKTALRFRTSWGLSINVVEKNWIYVDREEIPLLITALDTMKKQLQAKNFTPERSISLTTSNDVRLSLRYEDGIVTGGRGLYISQLFRHLRSDVPWKTIKMNTRYIDQLQEVLKKSLEM